MSSETPVRPAIGTEGGQKRRLRGDIQGLRAVAVLLVIADHAFNQPAGGFIGVDVFFVISGYLITGLLMREGTRSGTLSIREFYARRIRRIIPIALLVLLSTNLMGRLVFTTLRARQLRTDSVWALLFSANFHFSSIGTDYFQQHRPPSAVQHFWSLSVEEQFYVVWPTLLILAFLLARRRVGSATQIVLTGTAVITAGSFGWCVLQTQSNQTAAYFSTLARAWELGLGALMVIAQPSLNRLPSLVRSVAAWTGLGCIGVAAVTFSSSTTFPGAAAALPVMGSALVLAANNPDHGPGRARVLGNVVLRYLGDISYSLYLWHFPCIVLAAGYLASKGIRYYLIAAALPFVLSVASFHLIEEPIRRSSWLSKKPSPGRRRRTGYRQADGRPRYGLLGVLAVVVVAAAVFVVHAPDLGGHQSGGLGAQHTTSLVANGVASDPIAQALRATSWGQLDPSLDNLLAAGAPEWVKDKCLNISPADRHRCVYGDRAGTKTVVVLGDSMAATYLPAIRKVLDGKGWRIVPLTLEQCPFADLRTTLEDSASPGGKPYPRCYKSRAYDIDQVKLLRPDMIIVSMQAVEFVSRIIGRPKSPEANYGVWQAGETRELRQVAPYTGRLVVLGGPPGGKNLQECVTRNSRPSDCTARLRPGYDGASTAESAAAAAVGAEYVNPLPWVCSGGLCPAVIGTTPVYWDGNHFTQKFSQSLAPRIQPVLLPGT